MRTGLYVDNSNLSLPRSRAGLRLNFKNLIEMVEEEAQEDIVTSNVFMVSKHRTGGGFGSFLTSLGFEVHNKPVVTRSRGDEEVAHYKKWYSGATVQILDDVNSLRLDRVVFVTGDDTYSDLLEFLRAEGVEVWVVAFPGFVTRDVQETCDKLIFVEDELLLVDGEEELTTQEEKPVGVAQAM